MALRFYILASLCFGLVFLWAGWAIWGQPIWEYSYFIAGKCAAVLAIDTGRRVVPFLPYNFAVKIKIQYVLRGLFILYLLRILWETIAIFKGYDFMLRELTILIYLFLIICLIGYTISLILKSPYLRPEEPG